MKNQKRILIIQIILILLLSVPIYLNTFVCFFYVKSNSMYPEIPTGTVLVISNRHTEDLNALKGKPIVFHDPLTHHIVVHRLIEVNGPYMTTKGDNNARADSFRPKKDNLLGVVVFKSKLFTKLFAKGHN